MSIREASQLAEDGQTEEAAKAYAKLMFTMPELARSVVFNLRRLIFKLKQSQEWRVQARTIDSIHQLQIDASELAIQPTYQGQKRFFDMVVAVSEAPCSLLFVSDIEKREDVLIALLHRLVWASDLVFPKPDTNSSGEMTPGDEFYAAQWLYPARISGHMNRLVDLSSLYHPATHDQIEQVIHLGALNRCDSNQPHSILSVSGVVSLPECSTVRQLARELCRTDSELDYAEHLLGILEPTELTARTTVEVDSIAEGVEDWMRIAIERGLFSEEFYRETNPDLPPGLDLASHFHKSGWQEGRDPSQHFSLNGYKATQLSRLVLDTCPLEHFIRSENFQQRHPSTHFDASRSRYRECIDLSSLRSAKSLDLSAVRVAIHIHIHYIDSIGEILRHIRSLAINVDLLISTTSQQALDECQSALKKSDITGHVFFRITDNRGRDISAFVNCFTDKYLDYDVICKIHGKKSPHLSSFGTRWFNYLVENTLGSTELVTNIIHYLSGSVSTGILAPIPFTGTNNQDWAGNLEIAKELVADISAHDAESLGLRELAYPSGSVFWFKPKALTDLFGRYTVDAFPPEPLPIDGTICHAIERLIPYYASRQGFFTVFFKHRICEIKVSKEIAIYQFIANVSASEVNRKRKVLLFSHEASNTGAPRTAIGIHAALCQSEDYDCLAILLEGGPLEEEFKRAGPTLIFPNGLNLSLLADVFQATTSEVTVICNTCVTAGIGKIARNYGHRVVSLVHENASSRYWPTEFFIDALQSDVSVFPGTSVLEAAVTSAGVLPANDVILMPQGIYRETFPEVNIEIARSSVRSELGISDRALIVLGCGMLEKRKGIDIFIDTALRISRDSPHERLQLCFLWIGAVPASDQIYAKSQLKRLDELGNGDSTIIFLGEVTKVDRYFAASDIFFLSSRIDPFPGVVLEAMACSLPIVCFKQATEATNAFINHCGGFALDDLRAEDAALEIEKLLSSSRLRREMGEFGAKRLKSDFMFTQYSESLLKVLARRRPSDSCESTCTKMLTTVSANSCRFSVIVPAYNTPLAFLQQMIESVMRQTYDDFELIIAGSELSGPATTLIEYYVNTDSRLKMLRLGKNLGIAGNTNAALSLMTGSYVCFLDHDDMLHAKCLERVFHFIDSTSADFLYTDEDKVDPGGALFHRPVRKPEFSHTLLEKNNYISHLTVCSNHLLQRTGKLSSDYEGAQDYDFILRATELARNVVHIPEVLYHWREHQDSTSIQDNKAKEYATEAGRRALQARLKRQGRAREEVATTHARFQYRVISRIE